MGAKRTPPSPPPPIRNPNPSLRQRGVGGAELAASAATTTKQMLAFHFLRALSRIHRATASPVTRRTRNIRRAAYSSMARAASPRRAWSRAILGQARARRSRTLMRRAVMVRRRRVAAAASRIAAGGETSAAAARAALPEPPPPIPRQVDEPARADALRRLVPGGAGMEYCSLLEETADYMQLLRQQVQLMQGLVNLFSIESAGNTLNHTKNKKDYIERKRSIWLGRSTNSLSKITKLYT
uniref:IBH1-like N-terminal domain-containing protein n=1 Tax=Leersia perrieri TaxID=77586 RepID=A0A0D9WAN9_9ORYZ